MLVHFIHVPTTLFTATAEGAVTKDVTCEMCGHAYSYRLSRRVAGSHKAHFIMSRGQEKALTKARANLAGALETEHDDVPCPECGWHQPAHVASVRSRMYPDLRTLAAGFFVLARLAFGLVLFLLTLFVLLPDHKLPKASSMAVFALFAPAVASPGFLLLGLRRLLALNYRPNRWAGRG
ncbi:MAG TPA: hypothetical protein VGF55_28520 [Gemmataceae bacterium]|jgi:hypothetical protein